MVLVAFSLLCFLTLVTVVMCYRSLFSLQTTKKNPQRRTSRDQMRLIDLEWSVSLHDSTHHPNSCVRLSSPNLCRSINHSPKLRIMSSPFYYALFFAVTNGARFPRHDDQCGLLCTTTTAVVQAFNPIPMSSVQVSGPGPSSQLPVEYVYITESTTVSSTPTPDTPGTSNLTTTLASKTAARTGRSSNNNNNLPSNAARSTSWLQYGPGLPEPARSSYPSISGVSQ
jgi:hypothetical protein